MISELLQPFGYERFASLVVCFPCRFTQTILKVGGYTVHINLQSLPPVDIAEVDLHQEMTTCLDEIYSSSTSLHNLCQNSIDASAQQMTPAQKRPSLRAAIPTPNITDAENIATKNPHPTTYAPTPSSQTRKTNYKTSKAFIPERLQQLRDQCRCTNGQPSELPITLLSPNNLTDILIRNVTKFDDLIFMTDYFMVIRFPVPREAFLRRGPSEDQVDTIVKMLLALAPQMGFPSNTSPNDYDSEQNTYTQYPGKEFAIDTQHLRQNITKLLLQRNYNTDAHAIIFKTTRSMPVTVTPTYHDNKVLTYPILQRGFVPTLLDNYLKPAPVLVFAMQSPDSPGQYNPMAQDIGIFRGLPQPSGPDSKASHVHTTLTATAMLAITSALGKHTHAPTGWLPGVGFLRLTPVTDRGTTEDGKQNVPEVVLRILPTGPTATDRAKVFETLGRRPAAGPFPIFTDGIKAEFLESITNSFHGFGRTERETHTQRVPEPLRLPRHSSMSEVPKVSVILNLAVNVSAYRLLAYLHGDNPNLIHHIAQVVINPPAREPMNNPWIAVIIYHDDGVSSIDVGNMNLNYFAFTGMRVTAIHDDLMGMDITQRAVAEFPITPILATYPEYQAEPIILDGGEVTTMTTTAGTSSSMTSTLSSPSTITLPHPPQEIEMIRQSMQALAIQTAVLLQVQIKTCRSEIRSIQARIDECSPDSPSLPRLQAELEDAQQLLESLSSVNHSSLIPSSLTPPSTTF